MEHIGEHIYLEKAAGGDPEAFRYLFMTYYPKVKAFIVHFVESEAIAEELAQDIFERIWINREFLPNLKSFNAYTYRMAKNKAIDYLEHKTVERNYFSNYTVPPEISIEEELDAKELELLIQMTIKKMPDQRRRIFEMSRTEGLKNGEIAGRLQISKKTVENHLNQALKQIRNAITVFSLFF